MGDTAIVAIRSTAGPCEGPGRSSAAEALLSVSLSGVEKYAWASLHRLRVDLLEMLVKVLAGSEQLSLAAAVGLVSGPGWREAYSSVGTAETRPRVGAPGRWP